MLQILETSETIENGNFSSGRCISKLTTPWTYLNAFFIITQPCDVVNYSDGINCFAQTGCKQVENGRRLFEGLHRDKHVVLTFSAFQLLWLKVYAETNKEKISNLNKRCIIKIQKKYLNYSNYCVENIWIFLLIGLETKIRLLLFGIKPILFVIYKLAFMKLVFLHFWI